MSDFISSGIRGFLDYGIDLKLESMEEENYYITQMCEYFNQESNYKAYLSGDKSFEIEVDQETPVMEVVIRNSVLSVIPYTDDIFETFVLILGFIAKNHLTVLEEFRGKEFHKIEALTEVNKKNDNDEDDEDSDDYEWV